MKIFRVVPVWAMVMFGALALVSQAAPAEPMRMEALLVWGTDDPQSPDPKHHLVDADLTKRLKKLPYRWKYYFLVHREAVEVADGETKAKVAMSKHCILDIKNLGESRVEVRLHGDGKPVSVHREALPMRELFIVSGDAGNETGWLVILRRVERVTTPAPPPLVKSTN